MLLPCISLTKSRRLQSIFLDNVLKVVFLQFKLMLYVVTKILYLPYKRTTIDIAISATNISPFYEHSLQYRICYIFIIPQSNKIEPAERLLCILKKYFSEKRNVKSKKLLIIVEVQKYGRSYIYFCIFID